MKSDEDIMKLIRGITDRGNNCEVKKDKEGNLVVYEVKKKKHV